MFLRYFNFRENPFSLTINLAYLYLGHQHEEAIAHLTYAVSEGEGFIVITGKRGTGKTTVCRSFLEGLSSDVSTAYIDRCSSTNPQGLLLDINTAFGIKSNTGSIKDLADSLNGFLIQNKIEDRKVVVFIDDAHTLEADVLEQVRLISNLETTREKLLQLVLIGEPRLSEMLNSNELRQIGQRVSVAYHIGPLTYDETVGYIQHRLSIASQGPPIKFDPSAVRRIFKYSDGIPRKVNTVCSRALEIAQQRQSRYIDGGIAKAAVKYLSDHAIRIEHRARWGRAIASILVVGCLLVGIAAAAWFFIYGDQRHLSGVTFDAGTTAPDSVRALPEEVLPASPPADAMTPPSPEEDSMVESLPPEDLPPQPQPLHPSGNDSGGQQETMQHLQYSVQVGAFSDRAHAENLVSRLEANGYSARIVEIKDRREHLWHTVRIGDYPTREAAEKQARIFAENENMKTIIRPYQTPNKVNPE